MTDNRFQNWPNDRIDARFPEPGVDARFPDWPADRVDARFLEPGFDTRFEGDVYGSPRIITALIEPSLGPLTDGDNLFAALSTDALETSNYTSTAGTISTVTPAWTLNGSPASPDGSTTVEAGQVWALTITVVDSVANERTFSAGSRTVAEDEPVEPGEIATFDSTTITFDSTAYTMDQEQVEIATFDSAAITFDSAERTMDEAA